MVQVLKEQIDKKIVAAARTEFIAMGFKNASMRTIAKNADVPLSSIYSYYKSKNELYLTILAPVISYLDAFIIGREAQVPENDIDLNSWHQWAAHTIVELAKRYRDELNLLIFKSYGSSLEKKCEEYIDIYTKRSVEFMKMIGKTRPQFHSDISEFFLHATGAQIFAIIGEIVTHKLKDEELEKFVNEYVTFTIGGWMNLFNT